MEICLVCGKKFENRNEVRKHIIDRHLKYKRDGVRVYPELWEKWKRGELRISDLHKEHTEEEEHRLISTLFRWWLE